MQTIFLTEFRKNTEKWVRRAQGGDEITVTIYGKPTAKILPVKKQKRKS
jgi:prevent-host-death family protein